MTNAELATSLDLQTDHEGNDKNYLTWMILGDLLREGKITKRKLSTGSKRPRTEFGLVDADRSQ